MRAIRDESAVCNIGASWGRTGDVFLSRRRSSVDAPSPTKDMYYAVTANYASKQLKARPFCMNLLEFDITVSKYQNYICLCT